MTNKDFHGFPGRPNLTGYVAVPRMFFDEVLPNINNMSELKILLAVFRKTYGWVKEIDQSTGQPIYKLEDEISYSQFEKLTGLSSTSVATGLSRAIQNGYLEKVQQGNYSGTTSAYKVVTENGSKPIIKSVPQPKPQKMPKKETPNPVQYLKLDNEDVVVPKTIGKSLSAFTAGNKPKTEKESIIDEIFGTPEKEEPKDKKTPHQKFIANWFKCYYSKFNVPYGNVTGKEHGHIKLLLKDYSLETAIKGMEYYFNNYQNIEGVPADFPNIAIFFSWRKKIIPASINGGFPLKANRNKREFDESKWDGDDFFDN